MKRGDWEFFGLQAADAATTAAGIALGLTETNILMAELIGHSQAAHAALKCAVGLLVPLTLRAPIMQKARPWFYAGANGLMYVVVANNLNWLIWK